MLKNKYAVGCKCCGGKDGQCRNKISARVPLRIDMPLGSQHFWIQRLTSDASNIADTVIIEVIDVILKDRLRVNGVDFICDSTTSLGSHKFAIGADDNEAAEELKLCLASAFPTYTVSRKNNKITIKWTVTTPIISVVSAPLRITLEDVKLGDTLSIATDTFIADSVTVDHKFDVGGTDVEDTNELHTRLLAHLDAGINVTKRDNRLIFMTDGLLSPGYVFTGTGFSISFDRSFVITTPAPPTPYSLPDETIYKLTLTGVTVGHFVKINAEVYTAVNDGTVLSGRKFDITGDDEADATELRNCFQSPSFGIRPITVEQTGNVLTLRSPINFLIEASSSIAFEKVSLSCQDLNLFGSDVLKYGGFLLTHQGGWNWQAELDDVTITMTLDSAITTLQTPANAGQKIAFHNISSAGFSTGIDIVAMTYNPTSKMLEITDSTLKCCIDFQPLTVVAPLILKQTIPYRAPGLGGRASDPNNYQMTVIGHGSIDGNNGTTVTQRFLPDHMRGPLISLDVWIGGFDLGYETLNGTGWAVLQNDIQDTRGPATQSILKCNAIIYDYNEGTFNAYPELYPNPRAAIKSFVINSWPIFPFAPAPASDLVLLNVFVAGKTPKRWDYNPTDEASWNYADSPQMASKYVQLIPSAAVLDSVVIVGS